jgi:hypothetical protein
MDELEYSYYEPKLKFNLAAGMPISLAQLYAWIHAEGMAAWARSTGFVGAPLTEYSGIGPTGVGLGMVDVKKGLGYPELPNAAELLAQLPEGVAVPNWVEILNPSAEAERKIEVIAIVEVEQKK